MAFWSVVISGDHFSALHGPCFHFPSTKKFISCCGSSVCVNWSIGTVPIISLSFFLSFFYGPVLCHTASDFQIRYVFVKPYTNHNSLSIPCFKTICTVCPAGVARVTLFAAGSVFSPLTCLRSVTMTPAPLAAAACLRSTDRNIAQGNKLIQGNETDTK